MEQGRPLTGSTDVEEAQDRNVWGRRRRHDCRSTAQDTVILEFDPARATLWQQSVADDSLQYSDEAFRAQALQAGISMTLPELARLRSQF